MGHFDNRLVVVTGGTTGIGRACVEQFYVEGARVLFTGANQLRVDEAASAYDERVTGLVVNQADVRAIERMSAIISEIEQPIDALILNAGITILGATADETEDNFDHQVAVNQKGPFFTVQKLAPHVFAGGTIIGVTSCLNRLGMPGMATYAATKAALRSFVRTWAAEFKDRGIRVNCVSPGPIETPIYGKLGLDDASLDGMAAQIQSNVPLNRFGRPEEVAKTVLALAGSAGTYMTGEEVVLDGGWSAI